MLWTFQQYQSQKSNIGLNEDYATIKMVEQRLPGNHPAKTPFEDTLSMYASVLSEHYSRTLGVAYTNEASLSPATQRFLNYVKEWAETFFTIGNSYTKKRNIRKLIPSKEDASPESTSSFPSINEIQNLQSQNTLNCTNIYQRGNQRRRHDCGSSPTFFATNGSVQPTTFAMITVHAIVTPIVKAIIASPCPIITIRAPLTTARIILIQTAIRTSFQMTLRRSPEILFLQ